MTTTICIVSFLSTLSLRRATLSMAAVCKALSAISIHALLAESDGGGHISKARCKNFYPRSPCGERLVGTVRELQCILDFYPRSPCGERLISIALSTQPIGFLSTLSLRRATARRASRQQPAGISIHALLAESDSKSAQNSGALLRIWNKFYGDFIFMLTGKAVFYPFCPCFFHIFWCEGTGNFMIAFPSH